MIDIVGIVGKLNTGKSTAAKVFEQRNFVNFGFADPLRLAVHNFFDIDENILWGPSDNRGIEVRLMLQELGDFVRKFRPNALIELMRRRLIFYGNFKRDSYQPNENFENSTGVVIADIRYVPEIQLIKQLGGTTIKILREQTLSEGSKHSSETSIDTVPDSLINYTVNNYGTEKDLIYKINKIADEILT